MTAKITLYTRYEIPERRIIHRWYQHKDEPTDRALHVDVVAEWWGEETKYRSGPMSISVKGWCKRIKKDGSDSAHNPTDVAYAEKWLTPKDWKTITLRLMVDIASLTPPQEILVAFEEALDAYEAKCTYGKEES